MPKPSRRRSHCKSLIQRRYSQESVNTESDSSESNEELQMEVDASENKEPLDFKNRVNRNDMSDLFELCQSKCPRKYISVLLYMTMRYFGVKWDDCNDFLIELGGTNGKTAHKWANVFMSGDFDEFCNDNRGGKRGNDFFDCFPEIEISAKTFTVERCSRKAADFTANDLALFIDEQYYLVTQTVKDAGAPLVRSPASCRIDLRRWGARFEQNGNRPYFEGHERADVIQHRDKFIDYFLERKDHYYTITDGDIPKWIIPSKIPATVLIFHDESTFKSGEVSAKRWFFGNQAPFH
ncbi:unnamed protein product, partial [Rotaria sordida]